MALHDLDLGQLGLVSTTSGLQVLVTSSLQLAATDQDHGSLHILEAAVGFCAQRTWITLAADFGIDVELHLPDDRLTYRHDLAETLAQTLFDAPLWKQLQLEPKAKVICASKPESHVRLHICLEPAASDPKTSSRHKLAQDVPYYDIKPPAGVRTTEIRRVSLHMRFFGATTHKRQRVSDSQDVKNDNADEMLDYAVSSAMITSEVQSQPVPKIRRTRISPEWTTPSMPQSASQNLCGEARSYDQRDCPSALKRCYSTNDIDRSAESCQNEDIFTLFDAGLRYAIATPTKRSLKDVEVVGHESLKQLANICPAIFSPHHLESVSSRTVLLPTISHALTQVCGIHARSPVLRSKFSELSRRCGARPFTDGISPTTQDDLSVHLWHSAQAALFDSNAATRLKPISSTGSGMMDMLRDAHNAHAEQYDEAERTYVHGADLDDYKYDPFHEDLFESDESCDWEELLMEMTPESSQESSFEVSIVDVDCDMDDMLLC